MGGIRHRIAPRSFASSGCGLVTTNALEVTGHYAIVVLFPTLSQWNHLQIVASLLGIDSTFEAYLKCPLF